MLLSFALFRPIESTRSWGSFVLFYGGHVVQVTWKYSVFFISVLLWLIALPPFMPLQHQGQPNTCHAVCERRSACRGR